MNTLAENVAKWILDHTTGETAGYLEDETGYSDITGWYAGHLHADDATARALVIEYSAMTGDIHVDISSAINALTGDLLLMVTNDGTVRIAPFDQGDWDVLTDECERLTFLSDSMED